MGAWPDNRSTGIKTHAQSNSFMELLFFGQIVPLSLFTLHLAIIFYHASFADLSVPLLGFWGREC